LRSAQSKDLPHCQSLHPARTFQPTTSLRSLLSLTPRKLSSRPKRSVVERSRYWSLLLLLPLLLLLLLPLLLPSRLPFFLSFPQGICFRTCTCLAPTARPIPARGEAPRTDATNPTGQRPEIKSPPPPQLCHPERRAKPAVEGPATPPIPAHRSNLSPNNLASSVTRSSHPTTLSSRPKRSTDISGSSSDKSVCQD